MKERKKKRFYNFSTLFSHFLFSVLLLFLSSCCFLFNAWNFCYRPKTILFIHSFLFFFFPPFVTKNSVNFRKRWRKKMLVRIRLHLIYGANCALNKKKENTRPTKSKVNELKSLFKTISFSYPLEHKC